SFIFVPFIAVLGVPHALFLPCSLIYLSMSTPSAVYQFVQFTIAAEIAAVSAMLWNKRRKMGLLFVFYAVFASGEAVHYLQRDPDFTIIT
ncbi:MAG: hypothetical protein ACREAZ_11440, partial [Nitrososphaera sp.]